MITKQKNSNSTKQLPELVGNKEAKYNMSQMMGSRNSGETTGLNPYSCGNMPLQNQSV